MRGWKKAKLGDVAAINYGYTAKASVEEVGPKFLRITDIQNDAVDWSRVPHCPIDETDVKKYKLCDQDIVFARTGATTGKSYLVSDPPESVSASYLIRLRVQDAEVSARFISRYFQTREYWDSVTSGISGSAQGGFNASKLSAMVVPIPPIAEQKRIVAILDEAFEGIDGAIANAEKNLANARELFESSLQSIFINEGKDWAKIQLSELLTRQWITSHLDGNHGGNYPRKNEFVTSGVPYISANCIKNETIDMSLSKYLTPERAALLRKGIAKHNDVLFAHNATVGPVTVLRTSEENVILSTSLTYYRCDPNYIVPEYLALYMRSSEFKAQYQSVMRQSTRNQVPITKQRTFYHIIPPIEKQQKIARHLDHVFTESQRLEAIYQRKLVALNELKQSILQKAFSGELTAEASDRAVEGAKEVAAA